MSSWAMSPAGWLGLARLRQSAYQVAVRINAALTCGWLTLILQNDAADWVDTPPAVRVAVTTPGPAANLPPAGATVPALAAAAGITAASSPPVTANSTA